MKLARTVTLAWMATLALSGCVAEAGRNFERPAEESLALGKTTRTEILARFGPPISEGSRIQNGQPIKTLSYSYSRATAAAHASRVTPARAIGFAFADGVLVGYDFQSSFEEEHTDFNEARVADLKEGTTTREQLLSLLGPPQGRQIHPMIDSKGDEGWFYIYSQWKKGTGIYLKSLLVTIAPDGIIRKVSFLSRGAP